MNKHFIHNDILQDSELFIFYVTWGNLGIKGLNPIDSMMTKCLTNECYDYVTLKLQELKNHTNNIIHSMHATQVGSTKKQNYWLFLHAWPPSTIEQGSRISTTRTMPSKDTSEIEGVGMCVRKMDKATWVRWTETWTQSGNLPLPSLLLRRPCPNDFKWPVRISIKIIAESMQYTFATHSVSATPCASFGAWLGWFHHGCRKLKHASCSRDFTHAIPGQIRRQQTGCATSWDGAASSTIMVRIPEAARP